MIAKFSRMSSLPHFITNGAPQRARELRYYYSCWMTFIIDERATLLCNFNNNNSNNNHNFVISTVRNSLIYDLMRFTIGIMKAN